MKKISSITIILLIIKLILCSCTTNKKETTPNTKSNLINITMPQPIADSVPWEDLIDSISFIRLETNKDCGISKIRKIIVHNHQFYIHDFNNHRILVFNKHGRYVGKLEKRGKGPHEYIELRDFCISDNSIYILTYRKILRFTLNFVYKETLDIKIFDHNKDLFSPLQLTKHNDYFYLWRGVFGVKKEDKEKFSLIKTTSDMKVLESMFQISRKIINSSKFSKCQGFSNFSFYWGNDTIYQVRNSLDPKYVIDFGENQLLENNIPTGFNSNVGKFIYNLKNTKKCGNISNILEDDKLLYFTFLKSGFVYNAVYLKDNHKTYTGEIQITPPISPLIIDGKIDNKYFSIIDSYVLKNFLDTKVKDSPCDTLNDISYTDNPVLLLFNFKKNNYDEKN